jgi:hypothetical protein
MSAEQELIDLRPGCGYLRERDVAAYLDVAVGTLRKWRSANRGPSWTLVEGGIRYSKAALLDYLHARTKDRGTRNSAADGPGCLTTLGEPFSSQVRTTRLASRMGRTRW